MKNEQIGKHMQLWKVQHCNTCLTLTIHPTDPFPSSLLHFLFHFYFTLFSHGCHIQSSTSLQVYSAQYKSSRPVLSGPKESMPLKKTEKRTIPLSLWWLNFLTSFQKALKCLEARGRNKLMVDGEHWTNFRALSCSRLRLKGSSCLSSFKVLLPPAVSLKDLKRR